MKRSRFLALILVVAVMMMGAGYAYWQESLTITNTITTGELNFALKSADLMRHGAYIYSTSYCRVKSGDDKTIEINLENMYPGAAVTAKFTLENTGTMKAKVKNFNVSEFNEREFFLVESLKVNGVTLLENTSLEQLSTELNSIIEIAPESSKNFEIKLKIDPNADENDVEENKGVDSAPISFEITADVLQYNDHVN